MTYILVLDADKPQPLDTHISSIAGGPTEQGLLAIQYFDPTQRTTFPISPGLAYVRPHPGLLDRFDPTHTVVAASIYRY